MKKLQSLLLATALAVLTSGCGFGESSALTNVLVDANGRVISVEEIEAIVSDPALVGDEEEARQRLRDLGIEDEKLIDALLTL